MTPNVTIDEVENEIGLEPAGDGEILVGTEIEFPMSEDDETTLTGPGVYSSQVRDEAREDYGGRHGWPDGHIGSDPTAGVEVRSDPMSPSRLAEWFRDSIRRLEEYAPYEPTGYASSHCSANSFGLHIHMSPFDEETMEGLYQLSRKPWFKNFVCTSIVGSGSQADTYQVFRANYCPMRFDHTPSSSNACVTLVDGTADHWEWRMPEPMLPDNFDVVMRFIELLKTRGPAFAGEYAKTLVDHAHESLTSVQRAEAIGLITRFEQDEDVIIDRSPSEVSEEAGEFFIEVRSNAYRPYIYRAVIPSREDDGDDSEFYVLYTDNYEGEEGFEDLGVRYDSVDVINAHTMQAVDDEELWETLTNAVHEEREQIDHSDSPTKTDATDALIDAVLSSSELTDGPGPVTYGGTADV